MDNGNQYIAREYRSGQALAEHYYKLNHEAEQVRLFKEVAKESDYCILGFVDGLGD
jgi:hypothetical protein